MKILLLILCAASLCSCNNKTSQKPKINIEFINSELKQTQLFQQLKEVFAIHESVGNLNDSLSFLILPLQASCPSCRKKTIDSIMSNQNDLPKNHYITVVLNAGSRSANSYFRQQEYELPPLSNTFQFDSTNKSLKKGLYDKQPTLYYAVNQKVYKKVTAHPSTVREDLREFFSGYRNDIKYK